MKSVVLDANELVRDWLCTGLKYQLFEHMGHMTWLNVYVPSVVFEEVVANHAREVEKAEAEEKRLNRVRKHLGVGPLVAEPTPFDYREYLAERFDERLGFTILPWPDVGHAELASRAIRRKPPFDQKGSGYRDSLVWADVTQLARNGHDVALVSEDKVFVGKDGALASELQAEVEPLKGSVELVRDFNKWLIAELPWSVGDLPTAVNFSRNSEFYDYYLNSDFQSDLEPSVEDLGFGRSPYEFEIVDVQWSGDFEPVGDAKASGGMNLARYDLGETVEFSAEFPEDIDPEPDWRVSEPDAFRRVQVEGTVDMVVRVAVLFGDEFGFSVDELSWRRADGVGTGAPAYRAELDPNQLTLPDLHVDGSTG